MVATAAREVPAYVGYFAAFYVVKRWWHKKFNPGSNDVNEISMTGRFISGGFAGFFSWLVGYPQDIVKTKLQVKSYSYSKYSKFVPDGGFIRCAQSIYQKHGWRGFWVGFIACSYRGVIVGAVELTCYDYMSMWMRQKAIFN